MKVVRAILLFWLALAVLAALASPSSAAASWTVLVYLDGDNNLEEMGILDVNELERAPSSSQVNVLVQFDRTPLYDTSNGDWTDTRRYRITHDDDPAIIHSQLVADLGEVNMGAPETLVEFITWGAQNYPADHYLVVLWDHGSGWRAASTTPTKEICYDDTSHDALTTAELMAACSGIRTALGRNLDLVACDACLMGELELAYPLRAFADYYVASEEEIPGYGFAYDALLGALAADSTMSPRELCRVMVSTYLASYDFGSQGAEQVTLSAVDLAAMPAVASALTDFANELVNTAEAVPTYGDNLHTWWEMAAMNDGGAVDLRFFSDLVGQDAPNDALRNAAGTLVAALDAAVVANGSTFFPVEQHQGSSVYYPFGGSFEWSYLGLALAADTSWDEFLRASPTSQQYVPDTFEPDDGPSQAGIATLCQVHGRHWFHAAGDQDWVSFPAEAGRTYVIATTRLGGLADTVISLFAPDVVTLLAEDDDSGWEPYASLLTFSAPTSDTYYVMTRHYDSSTYGSRTYYDLLVSTLSFTDIAPGYWAFRQIEACVNAGIIGGYGDSTYRPTEAVNRAQMAVYVARSLAGGEANVPPGPDTATFPDVPTDHWAFRYVEYCRSHDVVAGYWDGYHPDEMVNRAQMAVYVSRAVAGGDANVPPAPDGMPYFPDVPADYWAYRYIEYAHDHGIVSGYWDGYHPGETVTRDQMAVYVARAFGL